MTTCDGTPRRPRLPWRQLTPLLVLVVGVGGTAVYTALTAEPWVRGPWVALHLLQLGLELPFGIFIPMLCLALWIGFDDYVPITALRLAAAYAVAFLLLTVVRHTVFPFSFKSGANPAAEFLFIAVMREVLPIYIVPNVVVFAIYAAILNRLAGVGWHSGVVVGLILLGLKFAAALTVYLV
jgi:hypothetical protein